MPVIPASQDANIQSANMPSSTVADVMQHFEAKLKGFFHARGTMQSGSGELPASGELPTGQLLSSDFVAFEKLTITRGKV